MYDSKMREKKLDAQYVLRLPKELLEDLQKTKEKVKKPISEIIRTAIAEYFKKNLRLV